MIVLSLWSISVGCCYYYNSMMLHKQELLHFKKHQNNWLMLFLKLYKLCSQMLFMSFWETHNVLYRLLCVQVALWHTNSLMIGLDEACMLPKWIRLLFVVLSCHCTNYPWLQDYLNFVGLLSCPEGLWIIMGDDVLLYSLI